MKEVQAPSVIREGDYQGLISFTVLLENNFNRLKSMSLEHEISNTTTMSSILQKFPLSIGEKWAEHLITLDNNIQCSPFPSFIKWLITQKQIWERVQAVSGSKGGKSSSTYFSDYSNPSSVTSSITCFRCGETGHTKRFCPKNKGGWGWK